MGLNAAGVMCRVEAAEVQLRVAAGEIEAKFISCYCAFGVSGVEERVLTDVGDGRECKSQNTIQEK